MLTNKNWGLSFNKTFTTEFGLSLQININQMKFKSKEQPVLVFLVNNQKVSEQETGKNDIITILHESAKIGDSFQIEIDGDIIFRSRC